MRHHPNSPSGSRWIALVGVCLGLVAGLASGCGSDEGSSSYRVFVSCAPAQLLSDGSNAATCSVQMLDQDNRPASSGTRIVFVSTLVGTTSPSGGFGTDVVQNVERYLDDAGATTITFRCTGVGSIGIVALSPGGERGAATVDCTQISGDWEVVRVAASQPGIRPGESTEVCAWAETAEGGPVTSGTQIHFTHDADNGGFGSSFADSRNSQTDGFGQACVVYVAQDGTYVETVTITANFLNTSFGNSPRTGMIFVDADLPENTLRCDVEPRKLVADGQSTAIVTCNAFGTGAAAAVGTTVECTLTGPASIAPESAVTDSSGAVEFTVTSGVTVSNEAVIECEAPGVGTQAVDSLDIDIITVGSIEPLDLLVDLLGVKGSGRDESTEVCFQVLDNNNQPFPSGLVVEFDGVGSSSNGAEITPSEDTTDVNGEVCTQVHAGETFGVAVVNARIDLISSDVTGTVTIPVRGVVPSRGGMTLTCAERNIGALRYLIGDTIEEPTTGDLCTTCELRLRDADGNLVGFDNVVTFETEAGSFRPTGQVHNDLNGVARVTWCADGPPPQDVEPFPDEPRWDGTDGVTHNPRDGLVTIMAYVNGAEERTNDEHWDLREPLLDVDDDNDYTAGVDEIVDVDDNDGWSGINFVWDNDTLVWVQTRILLTGSPYFDRDAPPNDEIQDVASGWPPGERLPFDREYPSDSRFSHWYVLNTTDGFDQARNVYYPENPADPTCNGVEPHCYIPSQSWFDGTVGLLVHYVLRDRNGNPMNGSLSSVGFDFHLTACGSTGTSGAIRVESVGYDRGLAPDSPFPFRFQIFRQGDDKPMHYWVEISDYVVGSVQTFSLTNNVENAIPPGGCRFQMIAPLSACPTCGDPVDTAPWEFFVINDPDL